MSVTQTLITENINLVTLNPNSNHGQMSGGRMSSHALYVLLLSVTHHTSPWTSLTTPTLYHNLPKSQIIWLQQIQSCLARAVVKAPKSSHITPVLQSLHWLKINERIEYNSSDLPTKFSQPPNLHICITLSQFSLLAALALHLWLHSLVHPHRLLYE